VAWFALTRITLWPTFGATHALVDDVFLHAQYGPAFLLGVLLAGRGTLCDSVEARRWLALAAAVVGWLLLLHLPPGPWRALAWSTAQWCAVVAAIGFARRHLQRDNALRRYLTQAVFPVYVLHQSITVLAAVALAGLALPPALEAALLVLLTLGLALAGFELLRRVGWLRPWFGIGEPAAAAARDGAVQAPASDPFGTGRTGSGR
jgi:glucan biosynthesis protein C